MRLFLEEVDNISSEDVTHVWRCMRTHDVSESKLLYPHTHISILVTSSVKLSIHKFVLKSDIGDVKGIGGISKLGQVWLVGTNALDSFSAKKSVLEQGRRYLNKYLRVYSRLYSVCSSDPGQLKAMRALGFSVYEFNNPDLRYIECVL